MRIEWTLFAITDREEIFDYIERDSPRAAISNDTRIEAVVDLLIDSPLMGRTGRVEGTRELPIGGTPYIAAYSIIGQKVRILRPSWRADVAAGDGRDMMNRPAIPQSSHMAPA